MANRSVVVRLKAEIADYLSNMRRAGQAAQETAQQTEEAGEQSARGFERLAQVANENREAWDSVSSGLMQAGTVGVAGLGLVTKAAMDWESAWAGVTKTVEGTPTQLAAVEDGLRGLARELPATHQEIAGIAEAAGQLGIATPDIVAFTRTMVNLGETTNLSAEEAATSLARFMNIMGTSQGDVSKLGSALVGLGNNFATTEAEIMAMSMRLAGTGNQIGLSEGEVMGLAAAMSSVGIEAEAGGTAMSMTMTKINEAVMDGGKDLQGFADVAGVSAEEFAKAWREDPAAALDTFVSGVGRASEAGENINSVLSDLGIKGVREVDTLLRLGGAAGLMGEAFAQGNEEIDKNSALAAEAAKRYETTESQVRIAWNGIKDSAIDAGAVMLPVVQGIAEAVSGLAQGFANLPAPVQGAITGLGGLVAVSALVVGGGMKMISMAGNASTALTNLGVSSERTRGLLGGLSKGVGVAVAAFAAFELAKWAVNSASPAARSISEVSTSIQNTTDGALDLDRAFQSLDGWTNMVGDSFGDLDSAMNLMHGDSFSEKMLRAGASMGIENQAHHAEEAFKGIDATLAQLASSGSLDQAAEGFAEFAASAERGGHDLEEAARASLPAYMDALRQLGASYDYPLEGAELMSAAAGELPPALVEAMGGAEAAEGAMAGLGEELEGAAGAAEETEQTLGDLFDLLKMMGMVTMDARTATSGFHDALRNVDDTIKSVIESEGAMGRMLNDTATDFDLTTEAGAAANQAFQDVAVAGWDMAEANSAAGASFGEIRDDMGQTYQGLIDAAGQFGITGDAAHDLAREVMGVPDGVDVESWMSDAALQVAEKTKIMLEGLPPGVDIQSWMSDEAFREAIKTKAAALDIPEHEAISSFMDSVARGEADKTTAAVLGIPEGADVHSWMSENAKNEAWRTKAAIDAIPKNVQISITTHKKNIETWQKTNLGRSGSMNVGGGALLPARASGGRIPSTGPGSNMTDGFLGVSAMTGQPTAWVDAGEWVITRDSSDKYNALLSAVNRDDPSVRHLAGYANGGRVREYATGGQVASRQGPLTASVDVGPIAEAMRSGMTGATVQANVKIGAREAKEIRALGEIKR